VSKISLRAAFILGQESPVAAQQVFTNRVTEIGAFDTSLKALENTLLTAEISPVIDRRSPRKNVLVYYGAGGIGKTTLSQELEARFARKPVKGKPARAAMRFDFAESGALDMESYVLRLRAGLGHLARSWPAFDIAFSVYWQRAHPGEALDEFLSRDSILRRAAHGVGLSDQIASTIVEVLGLTLPGVARAAQAVGGLLYGHAKKAIIRHRALRDCELLIDLLEAEADTEALSYFPYLLAWDLDRLPPPKPRAAVLLDTFEEVTSRNTSDMERWIQRSVYLMPNVLFVVTTRNRLDWADCARTHELDFTGPQRWPNLAAGHAGQEPRQHLVGYLSANDADSYLTAALTDHDRPAISAAIRERVVGASAGLPLYLDLAVTMFLDLLARGETPTVDDFGQPLPAVTVRILRDLSRDERDLLRSAALLDAFSLDMCRAACPHVPDSALLRFKDRPFLEMDPDRTWPYSLHSTLREAIRDADAGLRDSWSPRERAEAAARIGDYLRQAATSAAVSGDRSTQVAAVRQAIKLCLLTGQFFDWLTSASQALLTSGGWGQLPEAPPDASGPIAALLLGLQGARERRSGHLDNSIALLDAALNHPGLPPTLHRFLLLHRAHALRVAGRYAAGAADYKLLWQEPGDFRLDAGYWLADYSFLQGRFEDAQAELQQLTSPSADLRGEMLRLQGHIYRVNAMFDRAETCYRQALDLARDTGNTAAEGKALTDLSQTLSWTRPADARDIQARALEVNEALRNQVEIVKIHAAAAVALTGLGDLDGAHSEIERGLALTRDCGYPGGVVWCLVAQTLTRLRRSDSDGARESAAQVAATVDDLQGNRFWSEIVNWWTGAGGPASATKWLDGEAAARTRWLAVYSASERGEA
jgi:tetratricopeptide (TPR) repeat protein